MRISTVFIALFVAGVSGCTSGQPDALAELDGYCNSLGGYRAYIPPRTDWGPGYVFAAKIVEDDGGARLVPLLHSGQPEICKALYPPALVSRASVSLPDTAKSGAISVEAVVELLKGTVGDENKAKARLAELKLTDELEIAWGAATEHKFVRENLFDQGAQPIAVNRSCFNVIQTIKERKDPSGRRLSDLWVVTKAIATEDVEISVDRERSASTGAEFALAEILDISADANVSRQSENKLVISENRFVCYQPPSRLADWAPAGSVSGNAVAVQIGLDPSVPVLPISER